MNNIDKQHKNIFFDIFDTILSRTVQPEYTKKIWSNYVVKTLNLNLNMEDFYLLRNKIETDLGQQNHKQGKDYEFTYNEMIEDLYNQLSTINVPFKEFLKIAVQTEIDIESKVLYPNEDIINLIKKLKKENKKIYCVSDMYLSKDMIEQIFQNLNIKDLFDDFYISCEYLKNKKTGNLYSIILDSIKANPEECYMIGDNNNSDYLIPKSLGIESSLLNRQEKYEYYEKFLNDNSSKEIETRFKDLFTIKNDNFEHTIFSLYNFIDKLYFSLRKENAKEVFFLSREGEFLKKLFDKYQENIIGEKITTHYLLVSRKSTYLPSLRILEDEDFTSLLNQYSYISINEFLKSLNFTEEEIDLVKKSYLEELNENTIHLHLNRNEMKMVNNMLVRDFNKRINYFSESSAFNTLINNETFSEIYEKNRTEQKQNFIKYLQEKTDSKKIFVVDIGWNGSIQNNIQNILGRDYIVKGYYFGLQKKNLKEKIIKKGLIFTNFPKESLNYYLYSENRALFEIILGASHGSANKYIKNGKHIAVELFNKKEEQKIFLEIISKIQDKMYNIFIDICNTLQNKYYNNLFVEKLINQDHFEMIYNPNEKQLKFFNKIYHYENFGVFEFTKFNSKSSLSLKRQIKEHLKFFIRYRTYFDDTYWPILKLYNNKLYFEAKLYISRKKKRYKKAGLI